MIKNNYKIYFLGSDNTFSSHVFNYLYNKKINHFKFVGVSIKRSCCISRSKKQNFLKDEYKNVKFSILNDKKNYEEHLINELNILKPDIVLVISFGYILSKKIINLPYISSFINVHGSILPKYRGASPIVESIMNNDKKTGISFMKINHDGIDNGDIYQTFSISLNGKETREEIELKLGILTTQKLEKVLYKIIKNKIVTIKQIEELASYTKKITKFDGLINWNNNANFIERQFRAYNKWPKIYFYLKDKSKNKLIKIIITDLDIIENIDVANDFSQYSPKDTIISKNKLIVVCKNNTGIIVKRVIPENKKEMKISDFLSGLQNKELIEIK